MIRLNCSIVIEKSENRKPIIELAKVLVDLSLLDKGCITYDLYGSLTDDNHLMICETWQNEADLETHTNSEHFKRIVPKLKSMASFTLERFDF